MLSSPPLSQVREAGAMMFVSGQLAFGADGIVGTTVAEQTDIIFDRIEAALATVGATLHQVVKATVWLTDASAAVEFNAVYARRMPQPYPARSATVAPLLVPGALVEIDVIAVR